MKTYDQLNSEFEKETPQRILEWAIKTHPGKTGLSSSFGGTSAALIHMAIKIEPNIPLLFLDTGFLFKETHQFMEQLKSRLHLNVKTFRASAAQIAQTKMNLETKKETGLCCDDAKISLMQQSLKGLDCWIAGLQRSQSQTRKSIKIIEDLGMGLLKVHPLANWTSRDIYQYMMANDLPFHPLWEKGYTSIGCEPCTTVRLPGQDERSGRWAGQDKTECGVHTVPPQKSKET